MLCSNCGVLEICYEAHEPIACENGHNLCTKCQIQANDKCMICEGRLFIHDENAWVRLHGEEMRNWTPDMIREWSRQNELHANLSTESVNGDTCGFSEDCETASMNILYSKGEAYAAESPMNSDNIPISDSKWNHPAIRYPEMLDHYSRSGAIIGRRPFPKRYSKSKLCVIEDKSMPVKKDTRMNLVEQAREEIRQKILDEISRTFHDTPKPFYKPEEYTWVKKYQTIGVSTESTPRLLPDQSPMPSAESTERTDICPLPSLPTSGKFLIMNMDTSTVHNPSLPNIIQKKQASSCMDLRLHQIMGTVLESVAENPPGMIEDQHFYRLLRDKISSMPIAKLEEIISSIYSDSEPLRKVSPPKELQVQPPPTEYTFIPNCYSAYFNPPPLMQPPLTPSPQFKLISLCNLKISTNLNYPDIIDAASLNIPRSPVTCPISSCQRAFFVSDFTKHIAVDHTKVPIERILPHQCKNFFLDPKLIHFGTSRCQILLLIKNRIKNLGHEKFKDFIPVLVMSTKVSLLELCSNNYQPESEEVKNSTQNFYMLWLTGIMPSQLPIFYSLTVWARSGSRPTCHCVHSGRLYSVRNSQKTESVRRSGQMMLLSAAQIDILTNNGRHMLELQIKLH